MNIVFEKIDSFQSVGIAFSYGHEVNPFTNLLQVLWFRMEVADDARKASPSHTFFWVENAARKIYALRFIDLECDPRYLILHICMAFSDNSPERDFDIRLKAGWLFPPWFSCNLLHGVTVAPSVSFLNEAFIAQAAAMSRNGTFPPELACSMEEIPEYGCSYDSYKYENCNEDGEKVSTEVDGDSKIHEIPYEAECFMQRAHAFRCALNREIIETLEGYKLWLEGVDYLENYNLIVKWNGSKLRNRLQALHVFPWLFHDFGLSLGSKKSLLDIPLQAKPTTRKLLESIDAGQQLMPVLEERYGVSKNTLRYARSLLASYFIYPDHIPALLQLLDGMKPDKRPALPDEIRQLKKVLKWVTHWQLDCDRELLKLIATNLFEDGIHGAAQRIIRWCPTHNWNDPFADINHFITEILAHSAQHSCAAPTFHDILSCWVMDGGLRSFFEASNRWHQAWMLFEDRYIDMDWPPILPEVQHIGGLVVHELYDWKMLLEEGNAMRHCVGAYSQVCVTGEAFIFSLRTAQGIRKSTLHIASDAPNLFSIREHRGYANGKPDLECQDVALQLIKLLQRNLGSYRQRRWVYEIARQNTSLPLEHQYSATSILEYAMDGENLAPIRRRLSIGLN